MLLTSLVVFLLVSERICKPDDTRLITHLERSCNIFSDTFAVHRETDFMIKDFDAFDQLDFSTCGQFEFNVSIFKLLPSQPLLLDESLNLTGLRLLPAASQLFIQIFNLRGIDMKTNPFEKITWESEQEFQALLFFNDIEFKLFYDKMLVGDENGEDQCNSEFLSQSSEQWSSLFVSMNTIALAKSVKFSMQTCPLIFANASITYLTIQMVI